jgi:hypothetical protein
MKRSGASSGISVGSVPSAGPQTLGHTCCSPWASRLPTLDRPKAARFVETLWRPLTERRCRIADASNWVTRSGPSSTRCSMRHTDAYRDWPGGSGIPVSSSAIASGAADVPSMRGEPRLATHANDLQCAYVWRHCGEERPRRIVSATCRQGVSTGHQDDLWRRAHPGHQLRKVCVLGHDHRVRGARREKDVQV